MYICIYIYRGREGASEWVSEWVRESVSQSASQRVSIYIYNINDTCLTYDVISCKLSPFQVKKNPLVTSPSTFDSPGPWVISLLVDFYVRFGGWTINITYTVFISCVYIYIYCMIYLSICILIYFNHWMIDPIYIYIYIYTYMYPMGTSMMNHYSIYIYTIYIYCIKILPMITPSYPVLATFCPPKKKVLPLTQGRGQRRHGFQPAGAAWVPDKAFDAFDPRKKPSPKKFGTILFGIFRYL